MKNAANIVLIVGFAAVDFLFFHDIFKAGEVITLPQYATGLLSLVVFATCAQSLFSNSGTISAA